MTLNVADFGNDWNEAIAKAVQYGATKVTGRGTFPISETIEIGEAASYVEVDGQWSLLDADGFNGTVMQIADRTTASDRAEYSKVHRFRIEGSGGTDTATDDSIGVEIGNSLMVTVEDFLIQNMGGRGIVADKPPSGSTTLIAQQLELNRVAVRWTGAEAFDIGRTRALDSVIARNCFANHAGQQVTSAAKARGGAYIAAYMVDLAGWEISGIENFLNGMVVRKASGSARSLHFEDNCGNQTGSADLLLDTDANGLVVSGTSHTFGTNGARWCVETSSKGNRLEGIKSSGSSTSLTHDIIVHRNNATNCEVGPISYAYAPKSMPVYPAP